MQQIILSDENKSPVPTVVNYKFILILSLACVFNAVKSQEVNLEEIEGDDISITIESTPYSIKFSTNDENYELQNASCKLIKKAEADDNITNLAVECTNLFPCSIYLATIIVKNKNDGTLKSVDKSVETNYTRPNTEIRNVTADIDSLKLEWNVSDETCVNNFEIDVISADKEVKWTGKENNELLVNGLNPCVLHVIQLKTFDFYKELISNLTCKKETLSAEPGNVNVSVVASKNGNLKVTWEPPQYKTCINYYYLKWNLIDCTSSENGHKLKKFGDRVASVIIGSNSTQNLTNKREGACEWSANLTDQNAKEYEITSLQGCDEYLFEVHINSKENLKFRQQFLSPEQVPGPITLESQNITANDITLDWTPPKQNFKCVESYVLIVTGPLQRDEEAQSTIKISTNITHTTIADLDPCGEYNITIRAKSINDTFGEAVNSTFEAAEDKPSMVQNAVASGHPTSIEVSWDVPLYADLCLDSYRLAGWKSDQPNVFDVITKNTTVTIENLYSCYSYTVQIIPVTKNQTDGNPTKVDVETGPTTPQAPESFQAIGIFPKSLELSAKDLNNTCKTIYAHFVCEATKPEPDMPYKSAEKYVDVSGISFQATLEPLFPFTEYKCVVSLFNVAGWSPTKTIIKTTFSYFPDRPENLKVVSSTQNSVNFSWKPPKYPNGIIKLYTLHFQVVEPGYYRPPLCKPIVEDPVTRETAYFENSFPNLSPYTHYSVQVAAQNEYGFGEYTKPFIVLTEPWIADPVVNFTAQTQGPYESDTIYKANVLISFQAPCKSNGYIKAFQLHFVGEKSTNRLNFSRTVLPDFNDMGYIEYNETDLRPEYNYTVSVAIEVHDVEKLSVESKIAFDAPAGIPEKFNESVASQAQVNVFQSNNPTNSAVVRFPRAILESEVGTIIYVAILLSQKHCRPEPQMRFGAINANSEWPDIRSWNDVYKSDESSCIDQYQTTPLRWQPITGKTTDDVEFTVGEEKCDGTSKRYCNGPLKADTEYHLIIRLFTKSGYNDAVMLELKTDSLIQLTIILVSVSSCLLLAFIIGFIYLWITKRIMWHRESYHGFEDSFGDIISKNFALYYHEISKPEKIAREFKELTMVAMDLSYSAAEMGCSKNRYADIFPYDKNRVILDIDADGSDYINASFIDGYRRKKEYIATQGPKPESTLDFWRMILQYNVHIIVMATQFREGDTIKCHEYFPYKSKGINVTVKNLEYFDIYDRTELSVTHEKYGLKLKVTHLYFKKWPDHGCPTDPTHLITFVRKVKAEPKTSYSPIVVHCSAGVGRTGTFIGLDIIMQRLKSERKINIYETVKKLRFQRMKMVQTLTQYTFLYTCAYELVKHKFGKNTSKTPAKQNIVEISASAVKNTKQAIINESAFENNFGMTDDSDKIGYKQKEPLTIGTLPTRFFGLNNEADLDSLSSQTINERNNKLKNSTEM